MRRNASKVTPPVAVAEPPEAALAGSLALSLLREALAKGARRLHLQPREGGGLDVRMRTPDGLRVGPCPPIPPAVVPFLLARLKSAARLDVTERLLPQEGHLSLQQAAPDAPVPVRVSTLPTTHGEAVVMEMLEPALPLTLGAVGLDPSDLGRVREAIDASTGLVLVVGPSHSGKRTFLHACLRHVAEDAGRIVYSLEDGHPADVPGVISLPVRHEFQTTAHLTRALLHSGDADVIHIAVLHRSEPMSWAGECAAGGHLILGGLPVDDAASAVTRLADMGVEPYLLAASIRAIVSCRTLHALCAVCKVPAAPLDLEDQRRIVPRLVEEQILDGWDEAFVARAGGCGACSGTGHQGRVGVYEVVDQPAPIIDQALRSPGGLRAATLGGLTERTRTLRESAIIRAFAGHVSIAEAVRATPPAPGGAPPRPST